MFKIYHRLPDNQRAELVKTPDPGDAEAHYLRLCRERSAGPGAVVIRTDLPDIVAPASYRTDREWPAGMPREEVLERRLTCWPDQCEGERPAGPTPFQVLGLKRAAGLSRAGMAALLWVGQSTCEGWMAPSDRRSNRQMPPLAWWAALIRAGLHPEFPVDNGGPDQLGS